MWFLTMKISLFSLLLFAFAVATAINPMNLPPGNPSQTMTDDATEPGPPGEGQPIPGGGGKGPTIPMGGSGPSVPGAGGQGPSEHSACPMLLAPGAGGQGPSVPYGGPTGHPGQPGPSGPSGPSGPPGPPGPPGPSDPSKSCPNMRYCGVTSPLANLICYATESKNAFSYAFIGFNEGIVSFASINLNCHIGVAVTLEVIAVYGFMFRLTYPKKGCNKQGSKMWYLNFGIPGCPTVEEIKYYDYNNTNGQFNEALYPSAIEKNVASIVYEDLVSRDAKYNLQCNLFGAPRVDGDTLTTKISLDQVNSAILYDRNSHSYGSSVQYINDYGILGLQCNKSRTRVPGIRPIIYRETCAAIGYDRTPCCRNFQNSPLISEIVRSYDYDRHTEYLNPYEACKVATLWSQGYYCKGRNNDGYPSCPRNSPGGGTFTYINMALIPMPSTFINLDTPSFPPAFILYFALKGYGPVSIKEDIMKQFVKAC